MRFQNSRTLASVSNLSTLSVASGLLLFINACSTVPDDAPKEYHLASAAIERAHETDADKQFPITLDRAKADFKEALSLYDQSTDHDTKEPTRQEIAKAGAEKAAMAQNLAEKATELHEQVGAWDQKIEAKEQSEKSALELATLQNRVAMLDQEAKRQAALDSQKSQFQANMKTPVAFFATNQTGVTQKFQDTLDSLASTLKSNPRAKVTLVGYADKTGNMNHNNQLAEQRAENVATQLRSRGVMADQIAIDSQGSSMATATASNVPGLQLDRRVDAIIGRRVGADEMTTGR